MMGGGKRNDPAIRNANVPEEIRSPLGHVAQPPRGPLHGKERQAMNPLVRKERPGGGHGLRRHRLCRRGFTWCAPAVAIRSLPNLPSIRTWDWITCTRCWRAGRRKTAGAMSRPEAHSSRMEGERLIGQLEFAAGLSSLPREPLGQAMLNDPLVRLSR